VVSGYLLLKLGGNASPSKDDITKALSSVGVTAEADTLDKLLAELEGKDLAELLETGNAQLAKFGGGGGGGAAAAAAEPEKEEEKVEEEEMDVGGAGVDMFGGGDKEGGDY
jgi:large subunit ribosomal protein LP2